MSASFLSILALVGQGEQGKEGIKALVPADVAALQSVKNALESRSKEFAVVIPLDGNHAFFIRLDEHFGNEAKLHEAISDKLKSGGQGVVDFFFHAHGVAPLIEKGNLQ